jgi:hypothetical protein
VARVQNKQFASSALHEWCFRDGKIQNDKPNNVLVLFENQRIASSLLKASANEGPASFWITHSVIAFPVQGPCHRIFSKEIASKIEDLRSGGNEGMFSIIFSRVSSHYIIVISNSIQKDGLENLDIPRSDNTMEKPLKLPEAYHV